MKFVRYINRERMPQGISFSVDFLVGDRNDSIGSPTSSEGSQSPPHSNNISPECKQFLINF